MKLLHYLNEGRSSSINEKMFKDLLKNNCSDYINHYIKHNDTGLFRSISNNNDFLYINPSKHLRRSIGVKNYYTWIIDNSKLWSSYPKRSKSVIFINSYKNASTYSSNCYYVIPYNNSKIGICSASDIWYSFENGGGFELNDMIRFIDKLLTELKKRLIQNIDIKIDMYDDLKKAFNEIEKNKDVLLKIYENFDYTSYRLYQAYINSNTSFSDFIEQKFNPKLNGFRLITTKNLISLATFDEKEMWTDGECLLLYYHGSDTLHNLIKEL